MAKVTGDMLAVQ